MTPRRWSAEAAAEAAAAAAAADTGSTPPSGLRTATDREDTEAGHAEAGHTEAGEPYGAPHGDQPSDLYLKDWHCVRDRPRDSVYTVPHCISDDWLNWYAAGEVRRGSWWLPTVVCM